MDPRIKTLLAIVAGIVAAALTVFAGESVLHAIVPQPADLDINNKDAVSAYLRGLPASNWLMLIAVYVLAGLVGGYVTNLLSKGGKYRPALITGTGLALVTILNFSSMGGHPTWVWVASIGSILAAAWVGGRMA